MYNTRVLALLAMLVGLVESFSWDIVQSKKTRLEFSYDGTLTHTEDIPSANYISSVTYDPIHNRVLFADYKKHILKIFSFDLSTRNIQSLITKTWNGYYILRVLYDPVTQLLFWREGHDIYSDSLNSESSNRTGNLLVTLDHVCRDFAIDSCEGYIYWVTNYEIGRTQLNGSNGEVLIDSRVNDRPSLAIDLQTQKIYWIEKIHVNGVYQLSIESANFYGKNRTTLFIIAKSNDRVYSLTVSKDFLYWEVYNQEGIWQLPMNSSQPVARKLNSIFNSRCEFCHRIAAKYTIQEQIQGIKSCKIEQYLIPNNSNPEDTVSSSDLSVICQNNCLQGEDCIVSAEGQPEYRCDASNSGDRKVDACHQYCLNNGVCSLNEESKPVCQCTADYEGARCDVPIFITT